MIPQAVQTHFGRYVPVRLGEAIATGLWIRGEWVRVPLDQQRTVTADWAAGARAAGATAVIVNYHGHEADFQLDELV